MTDEVEDCSEESDRTASACSCGLIWLYITNILFTLRVAVCIVPKVQKLNLLYNGDVDENSASSSFAVTTTTVISAIVDFAFVKYGKVSITWFKCLAPTNVNPIGSALSDSIGRKPVLFASGLFFGLSAFLIAVADAPPLIYVAAAVQNFVGAQAVLTAWYVTQEQNLNNVAVC